MQLDELRKKEEQKQKEEELKKVRLFMHAVCVCVCSHLYVCEFSRLLFNSAGIRWIKNCILPPFYTW